MVTSMAISFHELTIPQQLNVISDALVKETITDAKCSNQFCHPLHPKEPIHVVIGRNKATSSFRSELYKSWGYQKAQALFNNKKIMKSKYFDPFNWEGVHQVTQTTPQMYWVWVSKHTSGSCRTNRQLSQMYKSIQNKCEWFGWWNDLTRCKNPGRTDMFTKTVTEFVNWMKKSDSNMELILVVLTYPYQNQWGKAPMSHICTTFPWLESMVRDCVFLGWENFTEGRICKSIFLLQQEWLVQTGLWWSISAWSREFLTKVLKIAHRQWLYWNARIDITVATKIV